MSTPWAKLPGRAVGDRRLSNFAFRLLGALGLRAKPSGKVWSKLGTMAKDLGGVSVRQVSKGIRELEELGYLHTPKNGGRGKTYRWIKFDGTENMEPEVPTSDDESRNPEFQLSARKMEPEVPTNLEPEVPIKRRKMEPEVPTEHPTKNEQPREQPTLALEPTEESDLGFSDWWAQYPPGMRAAKAKCRTAYLKIIGKREATADQLMAAVMAYGQSRRVVEGYAMRPLRWLTEGHHETDYAAEQRRSRDAPGVFEHANEIAELLERSRTNG